MDEFLRLTVIGVVTSAAYAIAASGLVVTYATSGIFNFSHGAIGMVMAYLCWQMVDQWHWPMALAVLVVVFVIAPALGALMEFGLLRRIRSKALAVNLVVTIGLLVLLIGLADGIWNGRFEPAPSLFGNSGWHLTGGVFVTWHETVTVIAAAVVAMAFRVLLYDTRVGIAMRAMVDQRDLVALQGAHVSRIATLSWAIGAAMAALAGVLIAPVLDDLSVLPLTFLVVYAYGAAVLGRLRSLPLTFAGALILGLAYAYLIGYLPQGPFFGSTTFQGLRGSVPVVMLFIVLLAMRGDAIEGWRTQLWRPAPTVATPRTALIGAAAFVVVVAAAASVLQVGSSIELDTGLAESIIVLSLVPLAGWAGQVSLCQMTFAGVGAFAMAHVGGGSILGILAAAVLAGATGAVVSLPALRVRGLYLALASFSFALAMENMFFPSAVAFGTSGSLPVDRPSLLGVSLASGSRFTTFMAVVFAGLAVSLLALRRGPLGRALVALRDSEAACATLGMRLTLAKLAVFTLSAAIAGVGGALLVAASTRADSTQFGAVQSLPIVLLAVVGGVATTSGAFAGGFSLGLLGGKLQAVMPGVPNVSFDVTGLAGALAGYVPDGIVPVVSRSFRLAWSNASRAVRRLGTPVGT